MDVITLTTDELADLEVALRDCGLPFTVAKEERYFGDAHTVSVVLDIAKNVFALLPPLLAFFASRKRNKVVINGIEIKSSHPLTDADKEKIKQALSQ